MNYSFRWFFKKLAWCSGILLLSSIAWSAKNLGYKCLDKDDARIEYPISELSGEAKTSSFKQQVELIQAECRIASGGRGIAVRKKD